MHFFTHPVIPIYISLSYVVYGDSFTFLQFSILLHTPFSLRISQWPSVESAWKSCINDFFIYSLYIPLSIYIGIYLSDYSSISSTRYSLLFFIFFCILFFLLGKKFFWIWWKLGTWYLKYNRWISVYSIASMPEAG